MVKKMSKKTKKAKRSKDPRLKRDERKDEFSDLQRLKQRQKEARENITLFYSPIVTMQNFLYVTIRYLTSTAQYFLTHKVTLFVFFPFLVALFVGRSVEGQHKAFIAEMERWGYWIAWWVVLGVLSSVGLGTGMHSGILFLFPHIAKVTLTAGACQSLDFEVDGPNAFVCTGTTSAVTFWGTVAKVWFPAFLWGAGTAIGEIPPYAVSAQARRAGLENTELEEWTQSTGSKTLDNMRDWMVDKLKIHGFWAILAFAAWPNMAFDLCGICCGHFGIPFWTFFGGTFVGKALIKVTMQVMFLVVVFNEQYLGTLVGMVDSLTPDGFQIHTLLQDALTKSRSKFSGETPTDLDAPEPLVKRIWGVIMILFIGWFAKSIVDSLAQQRQKEIDDQKLHALQSR